MKSSAAASSTIWLFALACLVHTSIGLPTESKVKVDVYYETLCPDSIGFIIRKLVPNYPALSSMIQLNLIPFGKAEVYEYSGTTEFYCQHGPKECRGNTIHACALAELESGQRNMSQVINYFECTLYELYGKAKPNIDLVASKCAKMMGMNWETLESCADGSQGRELLKAAGKKTKALRPKLTFVPTVVINGEHSASNQNKALYGDLVKLVCDNYSSSSKPTACTVEN